MARVGSATIKRLRDSNNGQVMALFALSLVGVVAIAAFVVDVSRFYLANRQLQASSDAVATALADQLPDVKNGTTTLATIEANAATYGAAPGNKNAGSDMTGVSLTFTPKCVTVNGSIPAWCTASTPNEIQIKQSATVNTMFAKVVGINSAAISATSTATMGGGKPIPAHIMIVLDRTGSMGPQGPSCNGGTKLTCAQAGIDAFLQGMDPSVDSVGLVVLPPATSVASACQNQPTKSGDPYYVNEATYDSASAAWVLVGLSNNYKASAGSSLNTNSNLYKTYHCIQAFGSTAYATAIDQAQAVLTANHVKGTQDAIVFMTDGEANYGPCTESGNVCTNNNSVYRTQPCHTAVASASSAKATGTWVYTIEYDANGANINCEGWKSSGSQGGSNCNTGKGVQFPCDEVATIQAKATLQAMASDASKFYYLPQASTLTTIFQDISADLGGTRLVDDNYTGS
jgi:Flp pilus assembly protein TadG